MSVGTLIIMVENGVHKAVDCELWTVEHRSWTQNDGSLK